jgi:hypothetical protein
MEKGESQELNLILKGDVSGSVEALEDSLAQIDVGDEVSLRVIDRGVGAITETNVDLAAASDAICGTSPTPTSASPGSTTTAPCARAWPRRSTAPARARTSAPPSSRSCSPRRARRPCC